MTLRNQHVQPEDLFLFGNHQISTGKNGRISVKTFFFGDHLIATGKTVRILVKIFFLEITKFRPEKPLEFPSRPFCFCFFCFLEITSFFRPNYSIFSVYFRLHKTGNPSYLSWPRAHFWSPAALYADTVRFKVRDT